MSIIKDIKQDESWRKFEKVFALIRSKVDLESSTSEALALHSSRLSRSIHGKDRYSPQTLVDAILKDLSHRARLVEIRVRNDLQLAILRESMSAMRRHINTEFNEELKEYKTQEQRRAICDRVLKSANQFLSDGETLLGTLDLIIKDIDQAGHSMRNIVECLKLLSGAKAGNVVV